MAVVRLLLVKVFTKVSQEKMMLNVEMIPERQELMSDDVVTRLMFTKNLCNCLDGEILPLLRTPW